MAGKPTQNKFRREKQSPPKPTGFGVRPGPAPWQASYGMYLTGHEAIEDLNQVAKAMEDKWGKGRLRLVVPADLREKFDRQRGLRRTTIPCDQSPKILRADKWPPCARSAARR